MRRRRGVMTYLLVGLLALGLLLPSGVALADEAELVTPAAPSVFTDVTADNDQFVYINYINARGLMKGFPDGSFSPTAGLTRAEAAVVMCKAANLNTKDLPNSANFTDVRDDYWGYEYINAAVNAGYLQGLGDGTYQPEEPLTRAQAISLILRLSTAADSGVPLPSLNDMNLDHWAARAMAMAIDAKMIDKKGNNIFPDQAITRGDITQALAILLTRDPGLADVPLYGILKINSGEVMLAPSGQEASLITSARQVGAGDTIKTLDKAAAQIDFPDGSSLLLKAQTEITLQVSQGRAYIKETGKAGTAIDDLQVKLHAGTVFGALSDLTVATMEDENEDADVTAWKKGANLLAANSDTFGLLAAAEPPWYKTAEKKKVKVKVDMPWGVAAIRGTFWQNTVNADGSGTMSVLEGSGSVTSGGETVIIAPGQATSGMLSQAPTPPAPMPPDVARGWANEQGWVNTTIGNMSNNVGAPSPGTPPSAPTAPTNIRNLLNQSINNAMQQVRQTVQANTPPSQSSGGGTTPPTNLSNPLVLEQVGINHIYIEESPQIPTWTIVVGNLQVGDIIKVYRNANDTTSLANSSPVPSGSNYVIFPTIPNLTVNEGTLYLTRTSTNKGESSKLPVAFQTYTAPAPAPDYSVITVTNNTGANDTVSVSNLQAGDRIIAYILEYEEDNPIIKNIFLSEPANANSIATISSLDLDPEGGILGIRLYRPGYYLNSVIVIAEYSEEPISSTSGLILENIIVNNGELEVDHSVYLSLTFRFTDNINTGLLSGDFVDLDSDGQSIEPNLFLTNDDTESNLTFPGLGTITWEHGPAVFSPDTYTGAYLSEDNKEIIIIIDETDETYETALKNFAGGTFTPAENSGISFINDVDPLPLITAYINSNPTPSGTTFSCQIHPTLDENIRIRLWKEMGESKSYLNKDYSEPDYTNSWNSDSNDSWFTLSPIESVLNISFFEPGIFHYIDIQINVGEDVYTLINVGNVHFVW